MNAKQIAIPNGTSVLAYTATEEYERIRLKGPQAYEISIAGAAFDPTADQDVYKIFTEIKGDNYGEEIIELVAGDTLYVGFHDPNRPANVVYYVYFLNR